MLVSMEKAGASYSTSCCKQFASVDYGTTWATVGLTLDAAGEGVGHAEVQL